MKIERLKIFTSKIEDQLHFYTKILGLEVLNLKDTSFEIRVGYSSLELEQKEKATPYHIAFHIPARQEEKALEWLRSRASIIRDGQDEIVNFPSWNARSVYFYDPDENVLEFISRRHCFASQKEEFCSESIIGISEIGVATSNVRNSFDFLYKNLGLKKYTGDYEVFCATGDDEGLFIVINKDKKDWFPSNDKAFASEFEINISSAARSATLTYKNERLKFL